MKWETIDRNQIDDLMAGKDPQPPSEAVNLNKEYEDQPPKSDHKGQDKLIKDIKPTNKPAGQL